MAVLITTQGGESFTLVSVEYIGPLFNNFGGVPDQYEVILFGGASIHIRESDYSRATLVAAVAALP